MSLPSPPVRNAMLLDIETGDRVSFTYMPPSFTEQKTADYTPVQILGRSEPMLGYQGSSLRVFNISLMFIVHGEKEYLSGGLNGLLSVIEGQSGDIISSPGPFSEVIAPVRLIRSWVYPIYGAQTYGGPSSMMDVPPKLIFAVGQWLRQRVVLQGYNINYRAPWGRGDSSDRQIIITGKEQGQEYNYILETANDTLLPFVVEVGLNLCEVNENTPSTPFDTYQVRIGADVLGVKQG